MRRGAGADLGERERRCGEGWGGAGTSEKLAVVGPREPGAPPSVHRVSRDNPRRFSLREQERLIGIVREGGNSSPPQGPIEGLESPICKYQGRADPKVGRARFRVRGCLAANGSSSQSFQEGVRNCGCE